MLKSKSAQRIYSLLIGLSVFVYVTGGRILNPTSRDWLMVGDSATHYMGWEFFRHTSLLQWPLGLNPKLGLDISSSVAFTDSIPLAAFIFKPFNSLLPATFQYLGLWILICFVLQTYLAARLLSHFLTDQIQIALGSVFIALSPVLIYRLVHDGYGHIALVSHFLILGALNLYFTKPLKSLWWALLFTSTILIQAYFIPMVAAIWIAKLVQYLRHDGGSRSVAIKHFAAVAVASISTLIAGGYVALGSNLFTGGSEVTDSSFPYWFRWQPLSLIDIQTSFSGTWSHLLSDQQELRGDVEGFSFLGSGIILLAGLVTLVLLLRYFVARFPHYQPSQVAAAIGATLVITASWIVMSTQVFSMALFVALAVFVIQFSIEKLVAKKSESRSRHRALYLLVAALAAYSMTFRPGIGRRTFFEYPLVPLFKQFTQTFHTHGRYIWPAYYLLVLVVIVVACRVFNKKLATIVLAGCLLFQVVDSASAVTTVRHRFTDAPEWVSPMQDPRWEELARTHKNIVTLPLLINDLADRWMLIADFASRHKMGTNAVYFSRINMEEASQYAGRLHDGFLHGTLDPSNIYIVTDDAYWEGVVGLKFPYAFTGDIDGFHVVVP
ncbi:MAG: hypothetical protein F2732_00965 [Actinobacteria bacterium]|uniref:Unannotated protein n=1 Tax=freshwater metagenome TaxID=449393 RepID=A0A6J6WUC8_9ZZZZ|nr:hypothetical protein [Actinomycetota bacterium]